MMSMVTGELIFVSYDVGMVEFFHDVNLLIDVFLQEGFLLDVCLADDFDSVELIVGLCMITGVLLRASIT